MKQIRFSLFFLLFLLAPALLFATGDSLSVLYDFLKEQPQVSRITALDKGEFAEKYSFFVTQPLDQKHPEAGSFSQRIFLMHVGFDRPTLFITEGYWANYALNAYYREELSKLFNMNIIVVEHRYFGQSIPQPLNWDFLTVENSVYDLHRVNTLFRALYPGKWATSGVSKGGQTTMFYRTYFPDDVDFSVPYVAPLNRGIEDGRHEPFIDKAGTAEERKKIREYQLAVWKRKSALMPAFRKFCEEKKYHFRQPVENLFDFCLLEYPFSIWQWGTPMEKIPASNASDSVLFDHLIEACDPAYFSDQSQFLAFDVQAARELGYYGYDTKPFKKYLSIKSSKDYLRSLMLPEGLDSIAFNDALYKKVHQYLLKNDPRMIYIYGEYDPWTASGVTDPEYFKGKKNLQVYVQPGGSHKARIGNMPEDLKDKILRQIQTWLEE